MKTSNRSTVEFFILAFLITWGIQLPMAFLRVGIDTQIGRILNIIAIFGPALAAIVVSRLRGGQGGLRNLLAGFLRWKGGLSLYVIALFAPYVLMAIALLIFLTLLGGTVPAINNLGALVIAFVFEWLRILILGGPLGEELGWRGYALPLMQSSRSAVKASVILGVIWGLWHLPSYMIPGTGQYEIAQSGQFAFSFIGFLAWTIALSILLTWFYNRSSGSLLSVLIFHTAINSAANLPFLLQIGDFSLSMLYVLLTWVAAVMVMNKLNPKHQLSSATA